MPKSQKASSEGIFSLCRALASSSSESIRKATKSIIVVHNLLLRVNRKNVFPTDVTEGKTEALFVTPFLLSKVKGRVVLWMNLFIETSIEAPSWC